VTAFTFAVLCGLPGLISFVLIPLSVLGGVLVAAALVVVAVVLAARGRPRRAGSLLLALLLPIILWQPITWTADCLHLALTVWTGAGQAGPPSRPDNSPFSVYDWSVGFAGGPNTFLIHDVTDEIALPLKLHRRPVASENGFGEDCAGRVRHLLGHYYVCTV
jgi:hypothetical protein